MLGAGLDFLFVRAQVAQLSGFVSADTAYHHGEASLQSTIIGLAHNFVGSNNVNVLVPAGKCDFCKAQLMASLKGMLDRRGNGQLFTVVAMMRPLSHHHHHHLSEMHLSQALNSARCARLALIFISWHVCDTMCIHLCRAVRNKAAGRQGRRRSQVHHDEAGPHRTGGIP